MNNNMNKNLKKALPLSFLPLFLLSCGNSRAISVEQSLSIAQAILSARTEMNEDLFSASMQRKKDGWFDSVDVRFQKGKYAYFTAKHFKQTSEPDNITSNDFYLFTNVLVESDSQGSLISVSERYIFAVNTKANRRKYNVITKEEFQTLLGKMEKEIRAQFKAMEDDAYDYLSRYDGQHSPVEFATEGLSYAPEGDENDFLIKAGSAREYQSRFTSVYFGSGIDEMRPSNDVYSEYHSFKNRRPYRIDDSFVHNKVASSSYKAAFTYGNCATFSWSENNFKETSAKLEFDPLLSLLNAE